MKLEVLDSNLSIIDKKLNVVSKKIDSLYAKIDNKDTPIRELKASIKKNDVKINLITAAEDNIQNKIEDTQDRWSNARFLLYFLPIIPSLFIGVLLHKYFELGTWGTRISLGLPYIMICGAIYRYIKKLKSESRYNRFMNLLGYYEPPENVHKLEEYQNDKKSKENDLKKLIENSDKLKIEVSELQTEKKMLEDKKNIILSVVPLNKFYDADDNNDLDIAETKSIELIIKDKQQSIREIEKQENRNYLKDFTKINIFLESFQRQLINDFKEIQELCEIEKEVSLSNAHQKIETFDVNITSYKALMSSLVLMMSNLENDDLVSFYKLYDIFDKLSVFDSNYEKKVIKELRDNNKLTAQLIQATNDSRDAIERALIDVGYEVNNLKFEIEWLGKSLKN